jgi:hypothetical protein
LSADHRKLGTSFSSTTRRPSRAAASRMACIWQLVVLAGGRPQLEDELAGEVGRRAGLGIVAHGRPQREVPPVGAVQLEVELDDLAQQGGQVEPASATGANSAVWPADGLGVERGEQLFLGGEVRVQRGRADAGPAARSRMLSDR